MQIDFVAFKWWIDFGILVVVVFHSGFVFWDRRNKVTQDAMVKLRDDLVGQIGGVRSEIESRRRRVDDSFESIKTRLSDTPTRVDLARLYEAIGAVSQVANQLSGTVESLQGTIQLINQHLLESRHG